MNIRPDTPDARDHIYASAGTPTPVTDLRQWAIDIEDQGWTGSCTGQAGTSALELMGNKVKGRKVELSQLFLYYNARLLAEKQGTDSGASMRDLCKAIKDFGVCDEALWPFNLGAVTTKPPYEAYRMAKALTITEYARCADIRQAVFDGYPVLIGCYTREALANLKGSMDTHLAQLKTYLDSPRRGGHAMVVVGYDDHDASYIIANSWGPSWADNGYFKIDRGQIHFDMFDAWILRGVEWVVPPESVVVPEPPAPPPPPAPEPTPVPPAPEPAPQPAPEPPKPAPKKKEKKDIAPFVIGGAVLLFVILMAL